MADDFEKYQRSLISGLTKFKEATPSDDTNYLTDVSEFYPRAIMIDAMETGIVVLEDEDGNTITFANGALITGVWIPMRPVKIKAATTATVYIGA
jgi:hypothetical protein